MDPCFLASIHQYHLDAIAFVVVAGAVGMWLLRQLARRGLQGRWRNAAAFVLVAATAGGAITADLAGHQEETRLQAMLEGFAPTYALGHEQFGYAGLSLDTAADDPTYLRLIEQQKQWLLVNRSAHDIYTFQHDETGKTVLVVDSETDYDRDGTFTGEREQRTEIGEQYELSPEDSDLLARAFTGEQVFDGQPTADRWGVWVSAYAPIHDPDGQVVAVVGVDYDASTWLRTILGRRFSTLVFFGTAMVLLLGSATILLLDRERAMRSLLASKNAELLVATQTAEAANHAKTAFLANMSHELRTPLTAILGFTDLLADPVHGDEDRRTFLDTIRRSGRHLLDVLSDILDLSKLEAGKSGFDRLPCDAGATAREVRQMLLDQARRKGLSLRVDAPEPLTALADPVRLRQVLVNLTGNAIKFTDTGGVVVEVVAIGTQQVAFRVVDTGPGLAPAQLAVLFQPFRQVDESASRRHGGTGLGLAISRRLAVAMGGSLEVTSRVGHGSTFEVRLPAANVVAPAAVGDTAPTTAAKVSLRGRVLLVEDGPDNRRLLDHILRRAGLEVSMACDGRAAVDLVLATDAGVDAACDLVLMDMQMPELDGYAATRILRGNGFTRPIVAITANALQGDRERCLAAGCDDFVGKPVDRAQLMATLGRWLRV